MPHYYNEIEPTAIAWLKELMADGLIADGHIDTRSIKDVRPEDLAGFDQCHFFAGIGGWSYALELAGLRDVAGIWTGSCPCQPYSSAGKRKGNDDDRNLWPEFFRLIRACQPERVFGEQVEAAIRFGWLDGISADLAGQGYAVGAAVLGAHSVGAPHIRQRLYWGATRMDDSTGHRREQRWCREAVPVQGNGAVGGGEHEECGRAGVVPAGLEGRGGAGCGVADAACGPGVRGVSQPDVGALARADEQDRGLERAQEHGRQQRRAEPGERSPELRCGEGDGLAEPHGEQWDGRGDAGPRGRGESPDLCGLGDAILPTGARHGQHRWQRPSEADGYLQATPWEPCILIPCRDGKTRRISPEPEIFPLVAGVPGRVGLLRGSGNAIVPQVAAAFVEEFIGATDAIRQ